MVRRTKIVATLGPASDSEEGIAALIDAGMNVARIGLAHRAIDDQVQVIRRVRAVSARLGRTVGVLVDLPGPKIRVGAFATETALCDGESMTLFVGTAPSAADCIHVDYPTLLDDIAVGDPLLVGDGGITLRVTAVNSDHAVAVVEHGGTVLGRPGICPPAHKVRLVSPTEDDFRLLAPCIAEGVDFVAVSFVRSADDLHRARAALGDHPPMLVAKIETPTAIDNLDEIIEASDAVMVARGDLGTSCALEDVPHLQKRIVRSCVQRGRPVITATQMLESMTHTTRPTRAEASDVANAVLDGTDALMLSGETAIGCDPVNAVTTMARIAERAEAEPDSYAWAEQWCRPNGLTSAMAHAAFQAARDSQATAILCCTASGTTARAMARLRPEARLVAFTPDQRTERKLALSWGLTPLPLPHCSSTGDMVGAAVLAARRNGFVADGDVVAVLAGEPDHATTDVLRLVRVVG